MFRKLYTAKIIILKVRQGTFAGFEKFTAENRRSRAFAEKALLLLVSAVR